MLTCSFEHLKRCLDTFVKYGIKPSNILRDLTSFRCSILKTELRLKAAKDAGVKTMMPWMVKCPEFDSFIERTLEENNAMGGNESISALLLEYFDLDEEKVNNVLNTYPRIARRRARNVSKSNYC